MRRKIKLFLKFWFYTIWLMFFWVGVQTDDACYFRVFDKGLFFVLLMWWLEEREEGELL